MHLAMDADRDPASHCPPPASLHMPTRSLPPAQPTWTACPIPATKLEGSTQTLTSDILWSLMPCRLSSRHWSDSAVLKLHDHQTSRAGREELSGTMARVRKERNP